MALDSISLDRLKNQLLTSGLQQRDPPLYQVVNQLIDVTKKLQSEITNNIATINNTINNITNNIVIDSHSKMGLLIDNTDNYDQTGFQNLIPGPRGFNGTNGINGLPGLDGENGLDSFIPGPKGNDGPTGLRGLIGPPGLDAEDNEYPYIIPGINGKNGLDGRDGIPGLDGNNDDIIEPPFVFHLAEYILPLGSVAGANTQIQYNNSGVFGASANFTWTNSTLTLSADGAAVFNDSGADKDFRIEGDTQANLFFVDASTDRIGIFTNVPDYLLHLSKSVNGDTPLGITNINAGTAARSSIHIENSGGTLFLVAFGNNWTTSGLFIQNYAVIRAAGTLSGMTISTETAVPIIFGVNDTEKARFTSGGSLVIGDTTVTAGNLFEVRGSVQFNKNQNLSTKIIVANTDGGAAAQSRLSLDNSTGSVALAVYGTGFSSSGLDIANAGVFRTSSTISGGMVIGTDGANPLIFGTNNTERARMDSSGNLILNINLGIGTNVWGTSALNVIGILNGTAPSTSPASMGQLYVESGALKYRGSSGTITVLGSA